MRISVSLHRRSMWWNAFLCFSHSAELCTGSHISSPAGSLATQIQPDHSRGGLPSRVVRCCECESMTCHRRDTVPILLASLQGHCQSGLRRGIVLTCPIVRTLTNSSHCTTTVAQGHVEPRLCLCPRVCACLSLPVAATSKLKLLKHVRRPCRLLPSLLGRICVVLRLAEVGRS